MSLLDLIRSPFLLLFLMTTPNNSSINQIKIQSEEFARDLVEFQHRLLSRTEEIQEATLEMVRLYKHQILGDKDGLKGESEAICHLHGVVDELLSNGASLIHSIQEITMDGMSVNRLKHQVSQINRLLDDMGL